MIPYFLFLCVECGKGYFGYLCKEPCPLGFYGYMCGGQCSPRCAREECDNVNGCPSYIQNTSKQRHTGMREPNEIICCLFV